MTKQEYTEYEESFKNGSKGFTAWSSGFCSGCQDCLDGQNICCSDKAEAMIERDEIVNEPNFSSQACDICGSHLGGDRYAAHALDDDNEIVHFEICTDCIYYMEYGQLDDMTMLEIEEN